MPVGFSRGAKHIIAAWGIASDLGGAAAPQQSKKPLRTQRFRARLTFP
jgi:hypothetical protein